MWKTKQNHKKHKPKELRYVEPSKMICPTIFCKFRHGRSDSGSVADQGPYRAAGGDHTVHLRESEKDSDCYLWASYFMELLNPYWFAQGLRYSAYTQTHTHRVQFRCLAYKLYCKLNVYTCRLLLSLETASSETFISPSSVPGVVSGGEREDETIIFRSRVYWLFHRENIRKEFPSIKSKRDKVLSLFGSVASFLVGKGRRRDCQSPLIQHIGALALSEWRVWVWTNLNMLIPQFQPGTNFCRTRRAIFLIWKRKRENGE